LPAISLSSSTIPSGGPLPRIGTVSHIVVLGAEATGGSSGCPSASLDSPPSGAMPASSIVVSSRAGGCAAQPTPSTIKSAPDICALRPFTIVPGHFLLQQALCLAETADQVVSIP